MNPAEEQLLADRQTRRDARMVLDERLSRVRGAIAQRAPLQRVGDDLSAKTRDALTQGAEIAKDSRWIIAGVGMGLVVWAARRPLVRQANRLVERLRAPEPASVAQRWLEWIEKKVKP